MSDPAARLARQRIQLERALIRFVIDRGIVPLSVVARFLDLADDDDPRRALARDGAFSNHLDQHYGALAAIESHLMIPAGVEIELTPEPILLVVLASSTESSARGTDVAPDLLSLVGDRKALFHLVARHSADPQAIWDVVRAIVDGSETVH